MTAILDAAAATAAEEEEPDGEGGGWSRRLLGGLLLRGVGGGRGRGALIDIRRPQVERRGGGLEAEVVGGAVGHAADQGADLVDHLRVEVAQRDVGVGMPRLQLQRALECRPDLAAQALGERLGDADALAVTAQRIGVVVPRIGVVRLRWRAAAGAASAAV